METIAFEQIEEKNDTKQDVPPKDTLNESKIKIFYKKKNQMNQENTDLFNPLNYGNEDISFATLTKLGKDKQLDSELFEQENKIIKEMLHNSQNKSAFGSKDARNLQLEEIKNKLKDQETPVISAGKYYRDLVKDHLNRIKNSENMKKNFYKLKRKPNYSNINNIDKENELNESKLSDKKMNQSQEVVEMNSYYMTQNGSDCEDANNDRSIPCLVISLRNTHMKDDSNVDFKNLNVNNDSPRRRNISSPLVNSLGNLHVNEEKRNNISLVIEQQNKKESETKPCTRLNYFFKPEANKIKKKNKKDESKLRINRPLKDNSVGPGSYEYKSCFDKAAQSKPYIEDVIFKNWVRRFSDVNSTHNLVDLGPGKYNPSFAINPIYKFKPSPFFLEKTPKDSMLEKFRLIKTMDRQKGPVTGSYHFERCQTERSKIDRRDDLLDYNEHSTDPKEHVPELVKQSGPGPGSYDPEHSCFDKLKNKFRPEYQKETKKIFDLAGTKMDLQTYTKNFRAKKKALSRIAKSTEIREKSPNLSPTKMTELIKPGPGTYDTKPSMSENLLNKNFNTLRYKIRTKQASIKKEDVDNIIKSRSQNKSSLNTSSKITRTYDQINGMLTKFDSKKTETCLPFLSKIPNWETYFSKENRLKLTKKHLGRTDNCNKQLNSLNTSDRYWLNDSKFDCYDLTKDVMNPKQSKSSTEKNLWIINNLNL